VEGEFMAKHGEDETKSMMMMMTMMMMNR